MGLEQEPWRRCREPHFELTNAVSVPGILIHRWIGRCLPSTLHCPVEDGRVGHEIPKKLGLCDRGITDQGLRSLTRRLCANWRKDPLPGHRLAISCTHQPLLGALVYSPTYEWSASLGDGRDRGRNILKAETRPVRKGLSSNRARQERDNVVVSTLSLEAYKPWLDGNFRKLEKKALLIAQRHAHRHEGSPFYSHG